MEADLPLLDRISDYPDHWAEARPDAVAFVHDDTRWSYERAADRIARWTAWLIDAGVGPGDRVAVLSNPRPEAIMIFLAAAGIGAIFQGLSPRHRVPELTFLVSDAEPSVLINLEPSFESADLEALIESSVGLSRVGTPPIEALLRDAGSVADSTVTSMRASVRSSAPAAIVYTSGSTGRPKGALLPHLGFTRPSAIQAEHFFGGEVGSIVNNLPIDHVGSLGNITATNLVSGGTTVFQERFDVVETLALIERHRINYWAAVPAMFLRSISHPAWRQADLSSVRRFIWSGGAAPSALIEELLRRCPRVSNSYGLTETVGELTFSDPSDDVATLATTIGRPDPRYDVRILRDDGSRCEPGETGEIAVCEPFVMTGYWRLPAATSAAFDPPGWLRTGDLARQRGDGCYRLEGRKSDMFKSGGYNIYPREIELAIEDHPGVRLAAVVAVPDELYGEVGHAFVLADPEQIGVTDLDAFLRGRLANHKVPKSYTIDGDFPVTGVGKIDKVKLRAGLL